MARADETPTRHAAIPAHEGNATRDCRLVDASFLSRVIEAGVIGVPAYRILIVEDDPLVALDIEAIVTRAGASDVVIAATLESAAMAARAPLDFALLDVDVLDGCTHAFATGLRDRAIPFAFVSASDPASLPPPLRDAPFVTKPFTARAIETLLPPVKPTFGRREADEP